MQVVLGIVAVVVSIVGLGAGLIGLFAPTRVANRWGLGFGTTTPAWIAKILAILLILFSLVVIFGLVFSASIVPIAWWIAAIGAAGILAISVVALITRLAQHERVWPVAVPGTAALATIVTASLLMTAWPGGVPAPTMAVPANPLWTGDTKPDPVPAENVVLSLPDDMYRHKNAPTEWWWHIGTLRSGDRVFGFEINAASFFGQGFAMSQISLSEVATGDHYEATTIYVPQQFGGNFDVSSWAEGDSSKDWYAKLGDPSWQVSGFAVTNGGSGYSANPTVVIEGDGTGAAAAAAVDPETGELTQVVMLNPGTGYTTTPTVTITDATGSGAEAVATQGYISMSAPQEDPTQNIAVQALVQDVPNNATVEFDLEFSQQGAPFWVFGTGIEPSATLQSLELNNYYFSLTDLAASGTITINGEEIEVTGTTWMDHEYGYFGEGNGDGRVRWLLQDMQLDNGFSISNAGIIGNGYQPEIGVTVDSYATIQDDAGEMYYVASNITPVGELWESPVTGKKYAESFFVEIPSFDAEFTVTSRIIDQEFALPSAPIFEGTADITGTILGTTVTGDAWIEQAF